MAPMPKIVDDMRRGQVQSVTDEGEVLLLFPGGKQRTIRIPRDTVPLVRRLADLDRELAEDRRRRA